MSVFPPVFLYKKCYFPKDIAITRAKVLYRRCVAANIRVCSPDEWSLYYYDLREFWDRYVTNINKTTGYIRKMLVGNVFTDYMSFMYASYPRS